MTNRIDGALRETTFEFDFMARRTKTTLPDSKFETNTYLIVNNKLQIQHTNFNGKLTTLDYDEMERLVSKTPDGSLPPVARVPVQFTYYPATGLRHTMTDASGTTTYQYDGMGRLTNKHHSVVGELNYTYDKAGNVLTIKSSHANGVSLTYHWDELNRLTQLDDNGGHSTTYSYDKVGNLQNIAYPETTTVKATNTYDSLNRLTNLVITAGGTVRASFDYHSDIPLGAAGNRLSVLETINGATAIARTVRYYYDNLHRLTNETILNGSAAPVGTINYGAVPATSYEGYDPVGNRRSRKVSTSALVNAGITDFNGQHFDKNDRLDPDSDPGNLNANFDFNGNTLIETLSAIPALPSQAISPSAAHPDVYDFENRLIRRSDGTTTIDIVYDGDGNRVWKVVTIGAATPTTNYFVVDDRNPTGHAQVLEELVGNGSTPSLSRVYNYGLNLISESTYNGSSWDLSYYGYDGKKDVRLLFSENGQITDTYTYDAFGILLARTGSKPNNYLYCGEQFDYDIGAYYLRARYYNPRTGRFWTRDAHEGSAQDPLSIHKYLYCHDDPVNHEDPSGEGPRISIYTFYEAIGSGHHIIPFELWDEIRFDYDAMQYLDDPDGRHGSRIDVNAPPGQHHNNTAHPRYTHEVRAEWENFLNSKAGKKFKDKKVFGRDAAEAFANHVKKSKNAYIKGFNSVVGGGRKAVEAWALKNVKKIPISTLKTPIFKKAALRLGKRIPYLGFIIGAATYSTALANARAAHDTEAAAQLEALAEVFNPLPFGQQDIRDWEASGKVWIQGLQNGYEASRFGTLLDD
jgi:RHS repeat-associated protein